MPEKNAQADYEIGYGKPPKTHQFKKGQSGNPKGRPKSIQKGEDADRFDVAQVLLSPIETRINGQVRQMDPYEASLRSCLKKALNGSLAHAERLIREFLKYDIVGNHDNGELELVYIYMPNGWRHIDWFKRFAEFGPPPWTEAGARSQGTDCPACNWGPDYF